MKLTVYRQAQKQRPDGTIVYKGEDAHPYVGDQVLFVADGMGGAAAIYHQSIVSDLFEKEKLVTTLFDGVYEDYSDPTFVEYVTDSFSELIAVKHCYHDSTLNMKKSGYFASRIVTSIILHEMLYTEDHKAKKIFAELASCESEESKRAYLDNLGSYFKDLIKTKVAQIADNANLKYESKISGLALLGTTLCATIYLEHEDSVEAIYLTAGDSRPYVWCEADGLSQVLADQEGKDGVMTNCIRANGDFDIKCDYNCFKKPFVLFNASDGCFDSVRFATSQLAFEKLIIDSTLASEDIEGVSELLTEFFKENGRHDDSSTIAMRIFGYDDYASFKSACQRRAEVLKAEYFDVMPDLFDNNYIMQRDRSDDEVEKSTATLKEQFSTLPAVEAYISEHLADTKSDDPSTDVALIEEKIEAEKKRVASAREKIRVVVAGNYVRFNPEAQSPDKKSLLEKGIDEYKESVANAKEDLDKIIENLSSLVRDAVCAAENSDSDNPLAAIDAKRFDECDANVTRLLAFLDDIKTKLFKKSKIKEKIESFASKKMFYIAENTKLAEENVENLTCLVDVVERIIKGEIIVSDLDVLSDSDNMTDSSDSSDGADSKTEVKIYPKGADKINEALVELKESEKNVTKLEAEKDGAQQRRRENYWNQKYLEIIKAVIDDPKYSIDEELSATAKAAIDDIEELKNVITKKAEQQEMLVAKYEVTYGKYMQGGSDE